MQDSNPPLIAPHSVLFSTPITTTTEFHLEKITTNLTEGLPEETILLGEQLEKAFHDKSNPDQIQRLVNQGAPVNYRLDYGLEIQLEAHFVYEFFLLLEGDKGLDFLKKNIERCFDDHVNDIYDYIKTSPAIYQSLHSPHANTQIIPVNPAYITALKEHVANGRANPYHNNGTLIIAAGLRNPPLVQALITKAKKIICDPQKNEGLVNFVGHFKDTAAVWSAILLDDKCLGVLLDNNADMENLGELKTSLLHWVTAAIKISATPNRLEKAKQITDLLINHGINLHSKNKLGISAIDYATGEFKLFLEMRMMEPHNQLASEKIII